jgi:hypothetical protein
MFIGLKAGIQRLALAGHFDRCGHGRNLLGMADYSDAADIFITDAKAALMAPRLEYL